jgi:Protein kinase domain
VSGDIPLAPGDPAPVSAGSQVAGYRLMEQIGRGGMAVVYRAIDVRLDRAVALKVLAPELARDDAFRHRFIRECRAAAAVDHPYIIPVFDAGEASGVLFIAMRYVSGRDVRTLLDRERTLPAWRTVNIIDQVASALDAAHERGLVHRDVKPANMLLDAASGSGELDHVYLSDFGLTKQALSTSSLTSTGQFLGTLDYIAPEQIEGRRVDGRADLYSLACTAFEMLAGSPPFRRDQGVAVIWAQVSTPPPQLTERRPDLPPEVDAVLTRALAKTPDSRYQTCLEFARALRTACGLSSDSAASGATGRAGPPTDLSGWVADAGPGGRANARDAGYAGAGAGGSLSADPANPEGTSGAGGLGAAGAGGRGSAAGGAGAAGRAAAAGGAAVAASAFAAGDGASAGSPASAAGGGLGGYGQQGGGFPPEPPTAAAEPVRPTRADRRQPSAYDPAAYSPPGHPGQRSAGQRSPSQYSPGQRPPGQRPPGQYPPVRRRPWWRSPAVLAIGLLIVIGLAGGALAILHARAGHSGSAQSSNTGPSSGANSSGAGGTPAGSASPAVSSPSGTVTAYFAALNDHDYTKAWALGGRNTGSSYTSYVNGYGTTAGSNVDILSVSGNVVTARITASQTDGTVKTFQGTYTVNDGIITQFNVRQTG